jgi:DNA-binding NtrC family response regulator
VIKPSTLASIDCQPLALSWSAGSVRMSIQITILVVEDEALIRMDIVDQLEEEGFAVFEASTADQAVDILSAEPSICLLLTDIDMPGSMDGLKLAVAVRRRWPPVKIIVISGHRIIDVADLPDGSMFFAKPYQHDAVMRSIRKMLS